MQNGRSFSGTALDAKPFVPRKSAGAPMRAAEAPGRGSGDRLQATAQPFVPPPAGPSQAQLRGMSSSAQPFVPQGPASGGNLQSPSRAHNHPHLPDSDDLLGMTALVPDDLLQGSDSASQHASPVRPAGGGTLLFRPQGPRLEPLPPEALPQRSAPSTFPGAVRNQAASPAGRGRSNADAGRGARGGRKPTPAFALAGPGPQPPAAPPQLPGLGGLPHLHHQPLSGQHPGATAAATSRAALLAGASAERLRQTLPQRSYDLQAQMQPDAERRHGLPDMLHDYHSVVPVEDVNARIEQPSVTLGVSTLVLKGIHLHNGQGHAIRRIDSRQVPASMDLLGAAQEVVGAWGPLAAHPHLVALHGAFASPELGSGAAPALCMAHAYYPGAVTLEQAHLQPSATGTGLVRSNHASEDALWSYLVQLTLALRAVHTSGLALRPSCLHHSKVLLVSPGRLRVGSVGLPSIVGMERHRAADPMMQAEDVAAIAQLMLTLACAGGPQAMEALASRFSPDFTRVVHATLPQQKGGAGVITTWQQLSSMLGERLLGELDARALGSDAIERTLSREAENGRLLRLLMRLSFVHERPRPDASSDWSDTGDRYLLKLFHDWLFTGIGHNGRPLLDWGRIVEALNKLDAGLPERIALLSRDEATLLAVSYADLKRCLNNSYNELQYAAAAPVPMSHAQHA